MTDAGEEARRRQAADPRRDLLLVSVAALAAALGGALLMRVTGVVGGDTPAHAYKTALVRAGESVFWDNRWYGGVYGPIDYGPLYYWIAALASEVLVTIASAALLPVVLFLYLRASGYASARRAALALVGVLFVYLTYGQGPFLLAMALTMAGMALLAAGRPCLAALPIGLGLFANPLALIVAAPLLVAVPAARPDLRRRYLVCLATLAPFVLVDVALRVLFWQPAWYLAEISVLRITLGYCAVGLFFAWRSRTGGAPVWRWFFALYAGVCVLSFVLPAAALGNNAARTFQLLGVSLLLAVEGVRLPRWAVVTAVAVVAVVQVAAPATNYLHPEWYEASDAAFWAPALATLDRVGDSQHRLHVVATRKHAEAWFVPRAGYAITRGWFRQADAVHNDLYRSDFGADEYVAWLRRMGVRYVLLPKVTLDYSSEGEPDILAASGAFIVIADEPEWALYRLVAAQAMVTPSAAGGLAGGPATVVDVDTSRVSLWLSEPGAYEVRVSWSPYWRATGAAAEIARSEDGFVLVRAGEAGALVLEHTVTPETVADRIGALVR